MWFGWDEIVTENIKDNKSLHYVKSFKVEVLFIEEKYWSLDSLNLT